MTAALMHECGTAPPGLEPRFTTITSSADPTVSLSLAVQGDPRDPPIVLLHGFADFWGGWARVIPRLASRFYVVAPDMRGFNRSSKPGNPNDPLDLEPYRISVLARDIADIVAHVAEVTRRQVAVVAHDWGGSIAWHYAHLFPRDLSRLMVIGTTHPDVLRDLLTTLDPTRQEIKRQQQLALAYMAHSEGGAPCLIAADSPRTWSANDFAPLFERLDAVFFRDPTTFPSVERDAYRRMWAANDLEGFKSQLKYYRANVGPHALPPATGITIPVPTTFVAPLADGAFLYPASVRGLRECIAPRAPLVVRTIDTGHFIMREEPEKTAAMIRQFAEAVWDVTIS